MKLPRLDFSGKNSKNVRSINSGGGHRSKGANDTEASEETEVCVRVVWAVCSVASHKVESLSTDVCLYVVCCFMMTCAHLERQHCGDGGDAPS